MSPDQLWSYQYRYFGIFRLLLAGWSCFNISRLILRRPDWLTQ